MSAFKHEPMSPTLSSYDGSSASSSAPSSSSSIACYPRRWNSELTQTPSSRHFPDRLPTLTQPSQNYPLDTTTSFTIPITSHTTFNKSRQDVEPLLSAASSTSSSISPSSIGYHAFPTQSPLLGSSPLSSPNHAITRQRTSSQVFHTTSDLAAHYGIPQFLPPAPRTTKRSLTAKEEPTLAPPAPATPATPAPESAFPENEFSNLCSDYLNMLSHNPSDTNASGAVAVDYNSNELVTPITTAQDIETVQALMGVLAASPEFRNSEFMTSPFDSPYDEFLMTPADLGDALLTSPVGDYSPDTFDLPLFGGLALDNKTDSSIFASAPTPQTTLEDLYTISPNTSPALDPSTIFPSPPQSHSSPTSSPALSFTTNNMTATSVAPSKRRTTATGTRKNLMPEALVPIDAPTQPRKYVTPSATSRKEVPAVFARKRARSQASPYGNMSLDDDDLYVDDDGGYVLPPNPTEAQLIEAKRRQNTLAARRSRKRKLEYQRELEESNQRLTEEREHWKARALTCEALLKHHGLEIPLCES